MKHRLYFVVAMLLLASIVLGACAAPAAPAPAAPAATTAPAAPAEPTAAPTPEKPAGKPLFVAINKSADQQYFIDLQDSFVSRPPVSWVAMRRSSMPSSTRTWA